MRSEQRLEGHEGLAKWLSGEEWSQNSEQLEQTQACSWKEEQGGQFGWKR